MALRYLWGAEGREEGQSFLRFITYVAIGGVALGVGALLLSLAIVRGFSQEITDKIIGFGAHIQVQSYLHDEPLKEAASLQEQIASTEAVEEASPIVEDVILLRRSDRSIDGVRLLGASELPAYMARHIEAGGAGLDSKKTDHSPLVVGAGLAERLGLEVGEVVAGFSLRSGQQGGEVQMQSPRVQQFEVTAMYNTSLTTIDDHFVITELGTARTLVGMSGNAVDRFDVTVRDVSAVDAVAGEIEDRIGYGATARTIYQIQPYSSLFAWIDLQQGIVPLVIGVIVIVAAFNIIGTLLMLILEKTREIGVLQSIGASQNMLKRLFLTIGLLIGTVGTTIGALLALALGALQQRFGLIPLPEEAYYMTTAPIALNPFDYLVVSVITLLLCGIAAYIPARVAAQIEPVRAIRFQ